MRSILSLVVLSLWLGACAAQLPSQSPGEAASQQTETQLETWIEMLDSPRYSDRVEASQKLGRLGVSAMKALERVTADGGVEASDRAFDILKRHHSSDDLILKAAAAQALQRIADQTDHPKSKAAERILTPATPNATPFRFPILPAPNNINRRIQIQVKIAGGDKDITVEENGKKIRVIENANGIQVEKSNGKGGVTKTTFKDVDELKEKDAEAHKAYKRAGGNGILPLNRRAMPVLPGQPQRALNLPDDLRKRHQEILKQHQQLRDKHKEMLERMKRKQSAPPARPPLEVPIETSSPRYDVVAVSDSNRSSKR